MRCTVADSTRKKEANRIVTGLGNSLIAPLDDEQQQLVTIVVDITQVAFSIMMATLDGHPALAIGDTDATATFVENVKTKANRVSSALEQLVGDGGVVRYLLVVDKLPNNDNAKLGVQLDRKARRVHAANHLGRSLLLTSLDDQAFSQQKKTFGKQIGPLHQRLFDLAAGVMAETFGEWSARVVHGDARMFARVEEPILDADGERIRSLLVGALTVCGWRRARRV